jgi:outer membrane protein, multidrug efflux system
MRYKAGVASFLEAIDSQRQLLSAEIDLVNSRQNRNGSAVQLYKAPGGGWTPRSVAHAWNEDRDARRAARAGPLRLI